MMLRMSAQARSNAAPRSTDWCEALRGAEATPEHYGRDAGLGGLEFLVARRAEVPFSRHFHDTYSIGVIEDGANGFHLRGCREVAPAGAICIVPPGEVHTGGEAGGFSYRNLYPSAGLLAAVAAELGGPPPAFRSAVVVDAELHARFRALFDSLTHRAPLLERESLLHQALGLLVERHSDRPPVRSPASREPAIASVVREYLDAHVADAVSLGELASIGGCSRSYVVRCFRRSYGLPPHAYQRQRRVELAKRLVLGGTPLAEAAADAGFADQPHMTRLFRQILGVTPGLVGRQVG